MHVLAIASGCLFFRALLYLNSEPLNSELSLNSEPIKKAVSNLNFQMADRSGESESQRLPGQQWFAQSNSSLKTQNSKLLLSPASGFLAWMQGTWKAS